jgi:hypothetical protein
VLSTKVTLERKGKKKKKGKQERELSTTPFPPSYPAPANSFPNSFPRVKVYKARLALIMFYNARPVLNARTTTKLTGEENHNASRKKRKKRRRMTL